MQKGLRNIDPNRQQQFYCGREPEASVYPRTSLPRDHVNAPIQPNLFVYFPAEEETTFSRTETSKKSEIVSENLRYSHL